MSSLGWARPTSSVSCLLSTSMPRNASVQAIEPTRCLALASWDLLDLLESDPKLSLNLIRGLATRVRAQGELHHH